MQVKATFLSLASSLFLISTFSNGVIAQGKNYLNTNTSISVEKKAKKSVTQVNMIPYESKKGRRQEAEGRR